MTLGTASGDGGDQLMTITAQGREQQVDPRSCERLEAEQADALRNSGGYWMRSGPKDRSARATDGFLARISRCNSGQ